MYKRQPWGDEATLDLTYLSTRASDGALLAEPVSRRHNGVAAELSGNSSVLLRALPISCLLYTSIPMIVEDEVVGILDLHSDTPEGLNADNLPVFTVLAAQLATAVRNARLFAEISETREQLARQTAILTEGGWQRFLEDQSTGGALGHAPPTDENTHLQQPIAVRGATIGLLELNTPAAPTPQAVSYTHLLRPERWTAVHLLGLARQRPAIDRIAIKSYTGTACRGIEARQDTGVASWPSSTKPSSAWKSTPNY